MRCISESALVQLDEDVLQRLSRSLHGVRDVSVPAAVHGTQHLQKECHRSPRSLPMHHSRTDQTKARADCVRALTKRLRLQWSPKQRSRPRLSRLSFAARDVSHHPRDETTFKICPDQSCSSNRRKPAQGHVEEDVWGRATAGKKR